MDSWSGTITIDLVALISLPVVIATVFFTWFLTRRQLRVAIARDLASKTTYSEFALAKHIYVSSKLEKENSKVFANPPLQEPHSRWVGDYTEVPDVLASSPVPLLLVIIELRQGVFHCYRVKAMNAVACECYNLDTDDTRLVGADDKELVSRLLTWMNEDYRAAFIADQEQVKERLLEGKRAIISAMIRYNASHPRAAFCNRSFMPTLLAMRTHAPAAGVEQRSAIIAYIPEDILAHTTP